MNKFKIPLILILIVCILSLSFYHYTAPVEAVVPALVLTPMIKAYIGAALVAAGMTFTTHSQINNAAGALWESITDSTRNALVNTVNLQTAIQSSTLATVGEIVNIFHSDVVLNNKPVSINSFWNLPFLNTLNVMNTNQGWNSLWQSSIMMATMNFGTFLTARVPSSTYTLYNSFLLRSDATQATIPQFAIGFGPNIRATVELTRNIPANVRTVFAINSVGTGLWYWIYINNVLLRTNFGGQPRPFSDVTGTWNSFLYITYVVSSSFPLTVNQAWSYGERSPYVIDSPAVFTPVAGSATHRAKLPNWKLYVPPAVVALGSVAILDWLLNRTHTDLEAETGVIVSTAGTTDLTGILGFLPSILTGILAIPTSIARFFDLTIPVNFVPLQVAGTLFTTRFPFSIPWDIARAFQITSVAGQAKPVFNINFSSVLTGPVVMQINLEDFDHLIQIQRQFLILLFIIGLAMLTPKILKV